MENVVQNRHAGFSGQCVENEIEVEIEDEIACPFVVLAEAGN